MNTTCRTALSAVAAIGIAVTGMAANSANAWNKKVTLPPRPAGAITPTVTYLNRPQESGNNLGAGILDREVTPGRDRLYVIAATQQGTENVALASWTCRATLYDGLRVAKQTLSVRSWKTNNSTFEGLSAFTPDASPTDKTHPRVRATHLSASCVEG